MDEAGRWLGFGGLGPWRHKGREGGVRWLLEYLYGGRWLGFSGWKRGMAPCHLDVRVGAIRGGEYGQVGKTIVHASRWANGLCWAKKGMLGLGFAGESIKNIGKQGNGLNIFV